MNTETFKVDVERSMLNACKSGRRSATVDYVDDNGGGEGKEYFIAWLEPESECNPEDHFGIIYNGEFGDYEITRGVRDKRRLEKNLFCSLDDAVLEMLDREAEFTVQLAA